MRIENLLQDLNITYQTEGHKHCRQGWINMECPFCTGNPGYHLGFSIRSEYFSCWRCGGHGVLDTIAKLSRLPIPRVRELIRQYGGRSRLLTRELEKIEKLPFLLPSGLQSLQAHHMRYLRSRNFDPEYLVNVWDLQGTGPSSMLGNIDYKNRIFAPVYWNETMVSFQCRALSTSPTKPKYKACPGNREILQHKHILYGQQEEWKETGICVEGITDVWRLGTSAFAVFGIQYTIQQVKTIAANFKKVAVVFDDDPQAVRQANRLTAELRFAGVDAWREDIQGDPGGLSELEAQKLVEEIFQK